MVEWLELAGLGTFQGRDGDSLNKIRLKLCELSREIGFEICISFSLFKFVVPYIQPSAALHLAFVIRHYLYYPL